MALAAASSLSALAAADDRLPADLRLTTWVQDWPWPSEPISEAIRVVTSTEVVVVAGVVVAVGLVALRRPGDAIACALLFAVLPAVQRGVKAVVDRPRPDGSLVEIRGSATSPSFPSGHVMSGTVLFAALAVLIWTLPLRRAWKTAATIVLFVSAVVNGFANVYEGVHWPSDVAGGYLWAAVLVLPFAAWTGRLYRPGGRANAHGAGEPDSFEKGQ
jgi:undecaprenyl-diphosphatase